MPSEDQRISDGMAKKRWMEAVARNQDRYGGDWTAAMSRTRREQPDLYAAFQRIGSE